MHISIEKKEFYTAVSTVARFAEKKAATLPVLSSVLLVAGDAGIKMRATNLETGIDLKVSGTIISEGVVALPATVLQQIAASLSQEGKVELEQSGDIMSISTATGKSSIKTIPSDDFPSIPFPENQKQTVTLAGTTLKTIFSSLAPCASTSMVRPELASLLLSLEGGIITAVATDSFRLAEKRIPLANSGTQGKILIPAKNAIDIAQILPDTEVQVVFDEHQCAFVGDMGMVVSRLTNASYPDYRQIIPKECVAEATILRKDFESALKRSQIFSDTFQKVQISLQGKKGVVGLFAKNAEVGESTELLPAKLKGEQLEMSFNHRYLAAVLPLTQAESLLFKFAGPGRPLCISGVGDSSLLYLISPMNQ